MISWVNPKVTIRNTEKKGLGSFANTIIRKNEVVIVQGGANDGLEGNQSI